MCTLENYKVTHLLKGFPRYRWIRKRTQLLPVGPQNGRQYECERAMHYPNTDPFKVEVWLELGLGLGLGLGLD